MGRPDLDGYSQVGLSVPESSRLRGDGRDAVHVHLLLGATSGSDGPGVALKSRHLSVLSSVKLWVIGYLNP